MWNAKCLLFLYFDKYCIRSKRSGFPRKWPASGSVQLQLCTRSRIILRPLRAAIFLLLSERHHVASIRTKGAVAHMLRGAVGWQDKIIQKWGGFLFRTDRFGEIGSSSSCHVILVCS
ncbi:UNVERIFIED_CONTAM: hypothetical protein K2H54_054797 [Gekko kuhli]